MTFGLVLFMGAMCVLPVRAASFNGEAGYFYERVSQDYYKGSSSTSSYVTWTKSDKGSHNMWFAVYEGGERKGKVLAEEKNVQYSIYTGNNYDTYLHLEASREHFFNPDTRVEGYWTP